MKRPQTEVKTTSYIAWRLMKGHIMLTSVCLIVIKVIYTQNIPTHVREWPSILLHVVLMSVNICLRALYIMDNNVGTLQTILLGVATQKFFKREWSKATEACRAKLSLGSTIGLSNSAMQMRLEAGSLPGWKQEMPCGVRPFEMGKRGLDLF